MEKINSEVAKAYEVIKNGGIILYPTDTVWGIGCDATNEEAVDRIFKLKKRQEDKSMITLVNERILYKMFKNIPQVAFDIMNNVDTPTTLVLDNPLLVAKNLIYKDDSLGVRVVNEPFVYKLLERLKQPLVSTSANISGQSTPACFSEIAQEIINGVDYIVDLNKEKVCKKSSAIIKLTNDSKVTLIRK